MFLRKLLFHIKGFVVFLWYKAIYGGRFKAFGIPSVRKGWNLMISPKGKVTIGAGCFFNNYCTVDCVESVSIGANCLFGESVRLYDSDHRFRDPNKPIKDQGSKSSPIRVGENCWLGSNVVVLKGSQIGDNVVIGAGCVISGYVPSNSIVTMKREYLVTARD